jgi:hypothetical protein
MENKQDIDPPISTPRVSSNRVNSNRATSNRFQAVVSRPSAQPAADGGKSPVQGLPFQPPPNRLPVQSKNIAPAQNQDTEDEEAEDSSDYEWVNSFPVIKLPEVKLKFPFRTLLGGLGLAVLADLLFYGKPLGVSVLIFLGCTFLLMAILGRLEKVRATGLNLLLMLPMAFFALMIAFRTNELLTALNLLAILALFALVVYFYAADDLTRLSVWGYPFIALIVLNKAIVYALPVTRAGTVKLKSARGATRWLKPVLRGVIIAAPIFLVFLILLTMALIG